MLPLALSSLVPLVRIHQGILLLERFGFHYLYLLRTLLLLYSLPGQRASIQCCWFQRKPLHGGNQGNIRLRTLRSVMDSCCTGRSRGFSYIELFFIRIRLEGAVAEVLTREKINSRQFGDLLIYIHCFILELVCLFYGKIEL